MFKEMIKFLKSFDKKDINPDFENLYKTRKIFPMTGVGISSILNGTSKFIDDNNCYLEIGTHRGSTLVSAAYKNKDSYFYGVDTFEGHNSKEEIYPFSSVEEGLRDAIKNVGHSRVKYFKEDYISFLTGRDDVEGRKVEVYLYDGDHGKEHQYKGLKLATNVLADKAIVFVDDSANNDKGAVWDGINKILKEDSRFSFIKEWLPEKEKSINSSISSSERGIGPGLHGNFWCGLVALKFER